MAPTFFGLFGIDCLLLGQQVPARMLPMDEPLSAWRARKRAADALVRPALPAREALEAFGACPEHNRQLPADDEVGPVRRSPGAWGCSDAPAPTGPAGMRTAAVGAARHRT
ncbi:hypothetical protein [Streptomyces sp. NPDC018045]|uniref:hypothetical protein n=1 Tax=Streptomyces sp. NPDC018045 TaxID=3365037 RepID=UPI0037942373